MNDVHHLKVDATDPVRPVVTLDGQDIGSNVTEISWRAELGRSLPEAIIALAPNATVSFDGLARVSVGEQLDPGPAAAQFLTAIDAQELERAALNRLDLDNTPGGLTAAMLRQLVDWALGK